MAHQSPNLFSEKRSSASPSPSVNSLGKEHSLRNSIESGNARLFDTGVQEITDIPDDYLSQSSVLKHLAKEVKVPSPENTVKKIVDGLEQLKEPLKYDDFNLPPPPEYPKWMKRGKMNPEKVALSKSQPDLSTIGLSKSEFNGFKRGTSAPRPKTKGREEFDCASEEMIDILIKENSALKVEIEQCYQKVAKAQKVSYC